MHLCPFPYSKGAKFRLRKVIVSIWNDLRAPKGTRLKFYKLKRNLSISYYDGVFYHLTLGFAENFFPAYLMAVGLGEVNAGLITTLPVLFGSFVQILTPLLIQNFGSYKRWVVSLAGIQAFALLILALGALFSNASGSFVFLLISIYWGTSMGISPVWNLWISLLIPTRLRPQFFAKRNRLSQMAILTSFLLGGFLLHKANIGAYAKFALLFSMASLFRFVSSFLLSKQTDVPFNRAHARFRFIGQPFRLLSLENRKLLIYLLALQFMVQLSSPFFTPFMLGPLHLSYHRFTILIASSIIAKVLFLPWFGREISKKGPMTYLTRAGIGISVVPALWCVSQNFYYLIFVQALTGYFWACHELSYLVLFCEKLKPDYRLSVLTHFNLFSAILMASSSLLGASLLDWGHRSPKVFLILFFLSSVGRGLCILLIPQSQKAHQNQLPKTRKAA